VVSFFGTLARRRKANVPEPHWYLAALGVDPPYQGRGLGRALVRDGLDWADMDGKIAYLETETESNVGFYEALGFDVVEEVTMDRLNLPMWLMARHPR
jgi:ribosomal protein S18 acetylase RimI-like enzyme